MTLTRLVNGVADAAQHGRVAKSVAKLAASAGLPRSAVDARHEATHNELPSLRALRRSAAESLAWLEASYWRAQRGMVLEKRARVRVALRRLDEEAGAIFEETFGRFGRRAGYGEREAGESGERSSSLKKKKTSVGRKEWRGAR